MDGAVGWGGEWEVGGGEEMAVRAVDGGGSCWGKGRRMGCLWVRGGAGWMEEGGRRLRL